MDRAVGGSVSAAAVRDMTGGREINVWSDSIYDVIHPVLCL